MNARVVRIALVVLAVAVVAGFVSLGRWQLARGAAKENFLREYAAAVGAEAQPLARVLDESALAAKLPRRVEGRGRYVPDATVLLDNQVRDGRVGVMVYTRFQPNGTAKSVLVNRGFVPMKPDRSLPDLPQPSTDELAIAGLLVKPPSAGYRLGNARYDARATSLLAYLDLAVLAEDMRAALAPAVLELSGDAPFGFERRFEPLPNTLPPERHRGYAVQWFGLAAAVAVITLYLSFRRR